jgi:acetylornithine/succinyldiaminopimelate/putrescine aminotransferase
MGEEGVTMPKDEYLSKVTSLIASRAQELI